MRVVRFGVLALILACVALWIWAHEPDSSALRAELSAHAEKEGLALACFYSIPATLTRFEPGDAVVLWLRTSELGFGSVAPDGKHLFVRGASPSAFSGLEALDGTPILAVAYEKLVPTYRFEVSPDLRRVALCRYGESVILVDLSAPTMPEIRLADDRLHRADFIGWSPTSSQIVFEYEQAVYIYDLAQGRNRRIASGARPVWSPDGAWIAFRSLQGEAMIIKPEGRSGRRIISGKIANGFVWSPDSRYLLFAKEYRIQIPLGAPGYLGAYRLSDGKRCKLVECSFKGMCTPEAFSWVRDYRQILRRFQRI